VDVSSVSSLSKEASLKLFLYNGKEGLSNCNSSAIGRINWAVERAEAFPGGWLQCDETSMNVIVVCNCFHMVGHTHPQYMRILV